MPLYEYECGKCAHKFELRRSFSEGANAACPQCNNAALRVFAPVPIVFKGSGFYVTDYRKEKTPSEGKSEVKPETKTETKTECKPEKKESSTGSGNTKINDK
jgi:putative FmdB family regulatory protein